MQYVHVKLLNGFPRVLTYHVPPSLRENLVGSIVRVPLKNHFVSAYVVDQTEKLAAVPSFALKEIHAKEAFPADPHYLTFINHLSNYYQVEPIHFVKRVRHFVSQDAEDQRTSFEIQEPKKDSVVRLTPEQQHIVNTLNSLVLTNHFSPALLHGVTGSGKTEVYKELIKNTLSCQKTAVLLLPEVSLALRFEHLLKAQLPSITIFGFHSGTRAKEKRALWQSLLEKKPVLIIGVHIPILLPIANLGCIIIDEEHDSGYQEKKHPKVNTKEAALMRAHLAKIPILFGSATPSISSLHLAKTKGWHLFTLHKRFAGSFPTISIVPLNAEKRRSSFWISTELQKAIAQRLAKKEQTIIFLNRRGYSFFVQCKTCSFIFNCHTCSVSLTLHTGGHLSCHYCGYTQEAPSSCGKCASADLLKKGIGTQQVVTILEQLFPAARIARADMDVSSKKKVWQKTMHDVETGAIDILVGTQTITKGYHFPKVTLVGVLWADLNLHFPFYNAAETCLQQLIQVAGRAGRDSAHGHVIIQTMMPHPIFTYLSETTYNDYYTYELELRKKVQYPPMVRLAEIELKHSDEIICEEEALHIAQMLTNSIEKNKWPITLLGPAKPSVAKIKNVHARKIYLKGESLRNIIALYQKLPSSTYKSRLFFTPNPLN